MSVKNNACKSLYQMAQLNDVIMTLYSVVKNIYESLVKSLAYHTNSH